MNEHLVHHAGALAHHLNPAAAAMAADLDPEHVETTEVLLSLLQQNKALSGNVVTFFEITTYYVFLILVLKFTQIHLPHSLTDSYYVNDFKC